MQAAIRLRDLFTWFGAVACVMDHGCTQLGTQLLGSGWVGNISSTLKTTC